MSACRAAADEAHHKEKLKIYGMKFVLKNFNCVVLIFLFHWRNTNSEKKILQKYF